MMFQNSQRDGHDDIISGKFLTVVALDYGTGARIIHCTPSYAIDRLAVSENIGILQPFLNVNVNGLLLLPQNGFSNHFSDIYYANLMQELGKFRSSGANTPTYPSGTLILPPGISI
jgi:hypothetical protein